MILFLVLFSCSLLRAQEADSLKSDTIKKHVRHNAVFISFGGPENASLDYAYRGYVKKLSWLAVDFRLGLGGSQQGQGFHYGTSAVFFRKWFKLECGGGLAFAQTGEWFWTIYGMRYEGKRGMLASLAFTPSFSREHKAYYPASQFGLGWRF
ncbi:MAG: hypothetical protein FD123_1804 [Bacteroidetes bacterium]|nr:MAG: hypothetical protein FD123_1804 [Bacteroidota bacterium]